MRHDHPSAISRSKRPLVWLWAGLSGALIGLSGGAVAAPDAAGAPEVGLWHNHSGKGIVEIRPCGTAGVEAKLLCGFIVWLKEPNNKKGEPLHDGYNEN